MSCQRYYSPQLAYLTYPTLYGMLVKSSHKLDGRCIFGLTFSLEMPPGNWASILWWEMTGLLLGAAVVKSYSITSSLSPPPPSLYFALSHLVSFLSLYEAFQPAMTATLKAKAHICLFHIINFNITPFHHIQKSSETIQPNHWWQVRMCIMTVGKTDNLQGLEFKYRW